MAKAKGLKIEDIDQISENKLLQFTGDWDSWLNPKPDFRQSFRSD